MVLVNTVNKSVQIANGYRIMGSEGGRVMKFIGWLSKVILSVLLISTLTVFTTGWVVNAYIKTMLASYNIQLPGESFGLGTMLQGMIGVTAKDTEVVKEVKEVTEKEEDPSEPDVDQVPSDEEAPADALPVMGESYTEEAADAEQQEQQEQLGQDQKVAVTVDEMARKKDDLIASDKEEIFNILMTKVPQEQIQEITVAMENGLTEQELKQVENTLSEYLNKDEYAKLITLLKP
jgi:hypothetical protein